MTKAERIYGATRHDCKRHIEAWGYQMNSDGSAVGFNFVSNDDIGAVCTRTLNAMAKLLNKSCRQNEASKKLGVIDNDKYEAENKILGMIEATIENTRKVIAR